MDGAAESTTPKAALYNNSLERARLRPGWKAAGDEGLRLARRLVALCMPQGG